LQIRVDSVVRDGTNRVGDLEFRLCELEADCDIGEPGRDAEPRRGGAFGRGPGDFGRVPIDSGTGPQLAVAEQDDFDRARAAFEAGDYAGRVGGASGLHPDLSRRPLERAGAFPAR
jgi:hypothetical protein